MWLDGLEELLSQVQYPNILHNTASNLKENDHSKKAKNVKEEHLMWCMFIDRYVILGGHRDAWVFGGIDPMSGSALTHEIVRSAGTLLSKGE